MTGFLLADRQKGPTYAQEVVLLSCGFCGKQASLKHEEALYPPTNPTYITRTQSGFTLS